MTFAPRILARDVGPPMIISAFVPHLLFALSLWGRGHLFFDVRS